MNDMASMRKMRSSEADVEDGAVVESGCGDFVRGGKAVVYQPE
jgi:hypothetical protein